MRLPYTLQSSHLAQLTHPTVLRPALIGIKLGGPELLLRIYLGCKQVEQISTWSPIIGTHGR
eukprot:10205414-Heterocapsa_arctica.AAC.1